MSPYDRLPTHLSGRANDCRSVPSDSDLTIRRAGRRIAADVARLAAESGHRGAIGALTARIHAARCVTFESREYAGVLGRVVDTRLRRGGARRRLLAPVGHGSGAPGLQRLAARSHPARVAAHRFYPHGHRRLLRPL